MGVTRWARLSFIHTDKVPVRRLGMVPGSRMKSQRAATGETNDCETL